VQASAEGLAKIERRGLANRGTDWFRITHAEALLASGRWAEAEAVVASVRTTAVDGPLHVHRNALAAQLRTGQGRDEEAWEHVRAVEDLPSARTPQTLAPVRVCEAALLLRQGRFAEARDVLAWVPGEPEDPDMFAMYAFRAGVEASAALAGDEAAIDHLDELVVRLDDMVAGLPAGSVRDRLLAAYARVRAEGTRAAGEPDPQAWRDALALGERRAGVEPLAWARLRLAESLVQTGDRDQARDELVRVHELATALGAVPLREEAEWLSARSRILLPRVDSAPPRSGSGLTARELEVLELLAEGQTNRQIGETLFISPKTASVHVSNLLMKLGAANRTEAATRARELGLLTARMGR
jgi:ATP/maltotriose-dependent transcriptional regulator MalT